MSEIDPLVAEILLKGEDEFLSKLKHVGDEAAHNFEKMEAALKNNTSSFSLAADGLGLIEAALAGVAAATIGFIEQQTALSQATILLADAFGTSAGELQALETIFASSGVKVEQFERFATRLTTTIAREWPQIAESVKMYATENDAAMLRVERASLGVEDAQKKIGDGAADRASRQIKNNEDLVASGIKLRFAAEHAAQEKRDADLAESGAILSVASAEQRLQELRSPGSVSKGAKDQLAIEQAELAVSQAREQRDRAALAVKEKAAEAAGKQEAQEREHAAIARKQAQDARDDAENAIKDEYGLRSAVIARAEAQDAADKFALTSVESIKGALGGIISGNKQATEAINLTNVSVANLTKGMFALSAETSVGVKPTGFEALKTIQKVLIADTDLLIDKEQRLSLVTHLAGTSMQALGKSASEILDVLEHTSIQIEELEGRASRMDAALDAKAIKEFITALNRLNFEVSFLAQQFASWAAPKFTEFLKGLEASLIENDGLIHNFITGIKSIAAAVSESGGLSILRDILLGIGIALVLATGPIGITIVALGTIITLSGAVRDRMTEIAEWADKVGVSFNALRGAVAAIGVAIYLAMIPLAPWTVILGGIVAATVLIAQHWNEISDYIGHAADAADKFFHIIDAKELARRDAVRETAAAERKAAAEKDASATAAAATAAKAETAAAGAAARAKADAASAARTAPSGGSTRWDAGRGGDYTGMGTGGGSGPQIVTLESSKDKFQQVTKQLDAVAQGAGHAATALEKLAGNKGAGAGAVNPGPKITHYADDDPRQPQQPQISPNLKRIDVRGGTEAAAPAAPVAAATKAATDAAIEAWKHAHSEAERTGQPVIHSMNAPENAPRGLPGYRDNDPNPMGDQPAKTKEGLSGVTSAAERTETALRSMSEGAENAAAALSKLEPIFHSMNAPENAPHGLPGYHDNDPNPMGDQPAKTKEGLSGVTSAAERTETALRSMSEGAENAAAALSKLEPIVHSMNAPENAPHGLPGYHDNDPNPMGDQPAKTKEGLSGVTSAAERTETALRSMSEGAENAAAKLRTIYPENSNSAPGMAEGGEVHGPGTTTSDSIMARLSRGEFVNNAKSVAHYGTDLFHALNNMTFPGFAMGGLVPSPVRLSGGGSAPATSTVNLSIDGRSFGSLRGSKSTVDDLSAFAISRQTSAAGSNPSWMK
jgi:hypothetical protein